jgi:hypothetical protein
MAEAVAPHVVDIESLSQDRLKAFMAWYKTAPAADTNAKYDPGVKRSLAAARDLPKSRVIKFALRC